MDSEGLALTSYMISLKNNKKHEAQLRMLVCESSVVSKVEMVSSSLSTMNYCCCQPIGTLSVIPAIAPAIFVRSEVT